MPAAELKVHVTEMLCYSIRQRIGCFALVVYVPSTTQSTCISECMGRVVRKTLLKPVYMLLTFNNIIKSVSIHRYIVGQCLVCVD